MKTTPGISQKKRCAIMNWTYKQFSELTGYEVYEILKLRVAVFVVEQECPYHEIDGHDYDSTHVSYIDTKGIAAYTRLLPKGVKYDEPSIGRVIVREDLRGTGLANRLMEHAMHYIIEEWSPEKIRLQAQTHLVDFYGRHGFEVISNPYLEDGIPHVDMFYHNFTKKSF